MDDARVVMSAAALQLRYIVADSFMFLAAVLQPFVVVVTAIMVLRHRADVDLTVAAVGGGLTGLWSVVLFAGSGAIGRERWWGTLEFLVASPTAFPVVFAGKMLGALAFAGVPIAMSLLVSSALLGVRLVVASPIWFALSVALALVALWSVGLCLAPLGILWRPVSRFLGVLEYPVYILCGFLIPTTVLPNWLQAVGWLLAPYWAARALQLSVQGALPVDFAVPWTMLLLTSVVALVGADRLFAYVLLRARRDGTLALT